MGLNDLVTKRARLRLEAQVMPGETVRLSSNLAASALVLTDRRVMIAPAINGAEMEINVPLRAVVNVAWKKGLLGPGVLTLTTGGGSNAYKVRNGDGANAAQQIRQAIAAVL